MNIKNQHFLKNKALFYNSFFFNFIGTSLCYCCFIFSLFLSTSTLAAAPEEPTKESATTKVNDEKSDKTTNNTGNTNPSPSIKIPEPISTIQQHKSDLERFFTDEEITPILVGPDKYLTVLTKNKYRNNKGVIILLPDWQQNIVSNKAINFLRKSLPEQGWTTMAVQPSIAPPPQTEEQVTAYKNKLSALIKGVIEKIKRYPGVFIVIAQGNHGAMLVDLYKQGKNRAPSGLILLSSYVTTNADSIKKDNDFLAKNVAESSYPVLDLYLRFDNPTASNNMPLRLQYAERDMKIYYRQRQLQNSLSGQYPEQPLLLQFNSWLKSIGW